jgi:type IV pilus assembly protein PilA
MKAMIMKRMALKAKDKKGFTLVEVIVVLVILAILMAIAVPSLTGYIGKAQDQSLKAEGRTLSAAAQTIASDMHNVDLSNAKATKTQLRNASGATTITGTGAADHDDWLKALNALPSSKLTGTVSFTADGNNNIVKFAYTHDTDLDTDSKWAYFDSTATNPEWVISTGATSPVTGTLLQP